MIFYINGSGNLEAGWYFYDEKEDCLGPWKTEWYAELVLSAYILNQIEGQSFLYLNLNQFLNAMGA